MSSCNTICVANNNCYRSGEDGGDSGGNFIKHEVSRMDTLAGIAIKYGVEVAEIRRLNNLVTDLQIFALKTLLIPLHGRHPPSPGLSSDSDSLSNGSASPRNTRITKRLQRASSNFLDVMQSLSTESFNQEVSPAMSTLREYYRLKPLNPDVATEETEMVMYKRSVSDNLTDTMLPNTFHLKSQKAGDYLDKNSAKEDYIHIGDCIEGGIEKSVRRRQTLESNSRTGSFEKLSKEESNVSNSDSSSTSGYGVPLRTKLASQSALSASPNSALVTMPVGLGDSILTDGLAGVANSSSLKCLQDEEQGSYLSIWPTSGWNFKADFQALTSASISIPIFDRLATPITGRRKAALD